MTNDGMYVILQSLLFAIIRSMHMQNERNWRNRAFRRLKVIAQKSYSGLNTDLCGARLDLCGKR